MDENLKNPQAPNPAPRYESPIASSNLSAFTTGFLGGGGIWLAIQKIAKKPITWKNSLKNAALVGLAVTLAHLITRKEVQEPSTNVLPFQPPAPPKTPAPQEMALGQIPQLLDVLVAKGELTPEHQAQVLHAVKEGRTGHVGDIAVSDGYVTRSQVDAALLEQTTKKAEAAIADIQHIAAGAPLQAPTWLKAYWGNNGVNPTSEHPTRADGVSAAANAAQNLVMLAKANPNPALLPTLQQGVVAAAYLARGMAQGDSAQVPLAKMGEQWHAALEGALLVAAEANPQLITDAHGKPIDIKDYITARHAEITSAIAQTIEHAPQKDAGHQR